MTAEWKNQAGQPMDWTPVLAVIFDVDGTLYHQGPVRRGMAWRLLRYALRHPSGLRELGGICHFRRLREEEAFRTASFTAQVQEAARRAGMKSAERLQAAIQRWMFEEPLALVAAHGNRPVLELLKRLRAEGKRIIIYSDYPPEGKLAALHVAADFVFYPGKDGLTELKPSPECMREILRRCALPADRMVYLGDREEKDGASARMAGMQFVLVSR